LLTDNNKKYPGWKSRDRINGYFLYLVFQSKRG